MERGYDVFMQLYLYQLECILSGNESLLNKIRFQSEEANTDEDLKLFFKDFMLNNDRLLPHYMFGVDFISDDGVCEQYDCAQFAGYKIEDVYLPNELTEEQKELVKSQKSGAYTNPDILLLVSNGESQQYVSIELKSTKNNKIPGSSVQQVLPNEWVIFIQHKLGRFRVATGQYINSITNRLPFPDRSPRPEIGFNLLADWNMTNRKLQGDRLIIRRNHDEDSKKMLILSDWHNYLATEWLDTIKRESAIKGEKWFNHTIRLFALELLHYYDDLTNDEQQQLRNSLQHLIGND
ncbi:MAG: hypothetical protein SNG14_05395 [Rikenellaceae bacterium]